MYEIIVLKNSHEFANIAKEKGKMNIQERNNDWVNKKGPWRSHFFAEQLDVVVIHAFFAANEDWSLFRSFKVAGKTSEDYGKMISDSRTTFDNVSVINSSIR